jgi:uncharacterized cupredoxin-like copper-binding protein
VLAGLVLASCGSSSKSSSSTTPTSAAPAAIPQVTIEAKDFSYQMPAQIPAGWVDVTLHNSGKQGHQIAFVKLGSMTFAQFRARIATTDIKNLPAGTVFVGGPNNVEPGTSVTATVKLDPGAYAVACLIPAADGKPHAAHGMIAQVNVVQTAQSVSTEPTATAGEIDLSEFTFVPSANFTGKGVVQFKNVGTQVHEAILVKLNPGKTLAEAKAFFLSQNPSGPPPFTSAGGIVGLGPQQVNYQTMALTPGHYVLLCFFPDPNKGNIPHALEGMIKEITVN